MIWCESTKTEKDMSIFYNWYQDKPNYSTFMLSLFAKFTNKCLKRRCWSAWTYYFIDEAHLIFKEASKALLEQIETIVKLIRSKGIGIYFITQNPMDVLVVFLLNWV
jgi:type IV secretory pathway VirB4 component